MNQCSINLPNGKLICYSCRSCSRGKLTFLDRKVDINSATANEVLHTPKLFGNIISMSKLTKFNFKVEFDASIGAIKHKVKLIGVANCINGYTV